MITNAQRSRTARPKPPPPPSDAAASSTEPDLRAAIDLGALGLIPWALTYLPHHFVVPPADFHWDLSELAEDGDRLAIAAPRGHAKTTLLALAFPLYRAAVHREPYTLIVSDTAAQAVQRTSDVHAELLENRELTSAYPHLALPEMKDYREKRVKRATGDFITLGGVRFTGAGAGQSLRGIKTGQHRPSLIIVDDLENDENVHTVEQREKLKGWFLKSLLNLPGHAGAQVIVIGTILSRDGLLAWLLEPGQASTWTQRRYRAIENEQPLWPAAWSADKLHAQRELIGAHAFASEYLNDPVPRGSTVFGAPTYYEPSELPRDGYQEATGCDFAYTSKAGDWTVFVTGRLHAGILYVTDLYREQAESTVWAQRLRSAPAPFAFIGGQEGGIADFLRKDYGINLITERAISDKLARAMPTVTAWNRGEVRLPAKSAISGTIEAEALNFTGDARADAHDDIVDALAALHHALIGHHAPTEAAQKALRGW